MAHRRLSLVPAERVIEAESRSVKATRRFLDFALDGTRLYEVMLAEGIDNVSPIWLDESSAVIEESTKAVARLLGDEPGDAPGGRVSVYICPECGDLGCGAVTVTIERDAERVTWTDWGVQNNYEDGVSYEQGLVDVGRIVFDRTQYETVLRGALAQVQGEGTCP
ncbi:MAG TPA: hypothetical protein VGV93_07375 [Acidimicrobiales bacterium]|nr:hypothetical protein [Acidimicrobiales bacterium]